MKSIVRSFPIFMYCFFLDWKHYVRTVGGLKGAGQIWRSRGGHAKMPTLVFNCILNHFYILGQYWKKVKIAKKAKKSHFLGFSLGRWSLKIGKEGYIQRGCNLFGYIPWPSLPCAQTWLKLERLLNFNLVDFYHGVKSRVRFRPRKKNIRGRGRSFELRISSLDLEHQLQHHLRTSYNLPKKTCIF